MKSFTLVLILSFMSFGSHSQTLIRIDGQEGYLLTRPQANECLIRSRLLKSAYAQIEDWHKYYYHIEGSLNDCRLSGQELSKALNAQKDISESLSIQLKATKRKAPKRLVQGLVIGAIGGFVGAVVVMR